MRKIGMRLYSAAARLLGPARFNTARLLGTALLCCSVLLSGCVQNDDAPVGDRNKATVQLNVGTGLVKETDGTLSPDEGKIHTLRVYAFVGGKPAGHYYMANIEGETHTFYMDLVFYSAGEQTVDFYVVANEDAMTPAGPALSETTSEAQLQDFSFTNQLRENLATKGLPMYCEQSVALDFTKRKSETPPAGSGHEGHILLDYNIEFSLMRPMAKIGVFVAKPEGETDQLHITGLTMLANGTQRRNYLMPPTPTKLQAVESGAQDIDIAVIEGEVTETLSEADLADPQKREDPANYTPVMNQPFYPFENPWGNGGRWDIPGNTKAHVLKIDYTYDGGTTQRSGIVYLPAVQRNQYVAVCCLIRNDGQLIVEYSIADWEMTSEYEIDFQYPNYDNPLLPASVGWDDGKTYSQPTIWVNTDPNSEEGSYTFLFTIRGPVNLPWKPVTFGATSEDFEVKVYQIEADGTKKFLDYDNDECVASATNPSYYIMVKALDEKNVGKEVSLGISYKRTWNPSGGSPLLLINGVTHYLRWKNTQFAEYVVLKQVDIPTIQKVDE